MSVIEREKERERENTERVKGGTGAEKRLSMYMNRRVVEDAERGKIGFGGSWLGGRRQAVSRRQCSKQSEV